jgi:adenylate cyclase
VVKFLGDGAMLHFDDAIGAVRRSLDLIERIPSAGLPSAHIGISAGPVIFRDGDYFGRTVNIASRVADRASPGEVLVAEEAIPDPIPGDVRFEPAERASLKGVSTPVSLYRVHRGSAWR